VVVTLVVLKESGQILVRERVEQGRKGRKRKIE